MFAGKRKEKPRERLLRRPQSTGDRIRFVMHLENKLNPIKLFGVVVMSKETSKEPSLAEAKVIAVYNVFVV